MRRANFSDEQQNSTLRHIALWTARDNLDNAYGLLLGLPDAALDAEVARWRARTSLRGQQWSDLLNDVATMSPEERDAEEWQYWRAVALQRLGQVLAAKGVMQKLSEQRSYYGFLAADELGQNYALAHAGLLANEDLIAAIESLPEMIRARELFLVGQDSGGRSEWQAAVRHIVGGRKTPGGHTGASLGLALSRDFDRGKPGRIRRFVDSLPVALSAIV